MIGLIENVIMIVVKKSLVFQLNVRATAWWIASYSFSFFMFVKDIGTNVGKLLALSPKEINIKNSILFKIFVLLVCLGLYFTVIFAFAPEPSKYFEDDKDIISFLEKQTGIWLAEYTKEQLSMME